MVIEVLLEKVVLWGTTVNTVIGLGVTYAYDKVTQKDMAKQREKVEKEVALREKPSRAPITLEETKYYEECKLRVLRALEQEKTIETLLPEKWEEDKK